jgi:hypothetical protein
MGKRKRAERLFEKTISCIAGLESRLSVPLGGVLLDADSENGLLRVISAVFARCAGGGVPELDEESGKLFRELFTDAEQARDCFVRFYSQRENAGRAGKALRELEDITDPVKGGTEASSGFGGDAAERAAEIVSEVWAPETAIPDEDILPRWRLRNVAPNPNPIKPTEVVLQLNGLYTLPDADQQYGGTDPDRHDSGPDQSGGSHVREVLRDPGQKVADYDHPVPLFQDDERHELVNCLDELDCDLQFEKEMGALPKEYRFPVLLSVSVTHEKLDELCEKWIKSLVAEKGYKHIKLFVLTERGVETIKEELLGNGINAYSVIGQYGRHFTALKYTQLLLEKGFGIRGGFKLDTDEGIRSKELYEITGKTWLQTLCHNLWGGTARDHAGRPVELAFNEGEYMNDGDIKRLGYKEAMREPDVKLPESCAGEHIFFNKAAAHARATALYNRFNRLDDHISHPVVKGGGYGITNHGLREVLPFTYSRVGRAEDQQFYFSGLQKGLRGIFHPDLRIAHYKGAVASVEKKTEAARLIADMYRLVLFEHVVERFGVKEEIDPMPGVFAGRLARAQAFFHLMHRALGFLSKEKRGEAEELVFEGRKVLQELEELIDDGTVDRELEDEQEEWERFVRLADSADPDKAKAVLDSLAIQ